VQPLLVAIDSFIFAILDRPGAYASLPEPLEDTLYAIEALRDYLLETCFGREIRPELKNLGRVLSPTPHLTKFRIASLTCFQTAPST
jgi:hypothetical protein